MDCNLKFKKKSFWAIRMDGLTTFGESQRLKYEVALVEKLKKVIDLIIRF